MSTHRASAPQPSRSEIRPQRVIILSGDYPNAGGDHPFVHPEIRHLAQTFEEVCILSFKEGHPLPSPVPLPSNCTYVGVSSHRRPWPVLRGLLSVPRLRILVKSLVLGSRSGEFRLIPDLRAAFIGMAIAADPRIVGLISDPAVDVTVYSFWGTGTAYSLPWLNPRAKAAVVRLHRVDLYDDLAGYRPLRPAVFSACCALLPISEHGRQYILARHPQVPRENILVRRLGVFAGGEPINVRSGETIHLVSCSSIIPVKRVDRILRLVAELSDRGYTVHWTHFGSGALEDSLAQDAEAAQRANRRLHIDLRGWTPHQDVVEHYRTACVDFVVNLSESEGIPVSLMEAAAWGIPILATAVGGTGELVGEDLGSGILVPKDATTHAISDAAERLINRTIRMDPREVWRDRFDADLNARDTASTIRNLSASAINPHGCWRP